MTPADATSAYWKKANRERWRGFLETARRMRDTSAEETLRMAFDLTAFADELSRAVP